MVDRSQTHNGSAEGAAQGPHQTPSAIDPDIRTLHALSEVFCSTLERLNEIAAQHCKTLLSVAVASTDPSRPLLRSSTKPGSSDHRGLPASDGFAALTGQINETWNRYREARPSGPSTVERPPAEGDAGGSETGESAGGARAKLMNAAFANVIASIHAAMQSSVANQQAMNQLGVAVTAKAVQTVTDGAANEPPISVVKMDT